MLHAFQYESSISEFYSHLVAVVCSPLTLYCYTAELGLWIYIFPSPHPHSHPPPHNLDNSTQACKETEGDAGQMLRPLCKLLPIWQFPSLWDSQGSRATAIPRANPGVGAGIRRTVGGTQAIDLTTWKPVIWGKATCHGSHKLPNWNLIGGPSIVDWVGELLTCTSMYRSRDWHLPHYLLPTCQKHYGS